MCSGAATVCPGRYLDLQALRRRLEENGRGTTGPGGLVLREDTAPAPAADLVRPEPIGSVLWRVLAGVYRTRPEAEQRARQLHEMGIDAIVVTPG